MRYDLVIFDLDGTILDTLDDLAAAANHALRQGGFPTRTRDEVRRFVGNGVANLMRRAVPEGTPEDVTMALLREFRAYYASHLSVHTAPYPGVEAMLRALNAAGVRCAVNSNKPDEAVKALCGKFYDGLFAAVLGERAGTPRKPAPDGARMIMRETGAAPERTLYVGDGDADILTAENAGVDGAWVSWGFRTREELSGLTIPRAFDSVEALKDFILA